MVTQPPHRRGNPVSKHCAPAALTARQHRVLVAQLETQRAVLRERLQRARETVQVRTDPGDTIDSATAQMTAALTMRLIARDAALLGEVDQALARVAAGTYGRCEGSGEPIGYARLKVRPWARCSVAYAQEREELMLAGQSRRREARRRRGCLPDTPAAGHQSGGRRRGASGPHAGGSVEDDREQNDSAD